MNRFQASALSLAAASSLLCGALSAQPAEEPKVPADSFGNRDSFVLSVERIFGFQSQKFCEDDNCTTLDSAGIHPFYWGNIGLFSIQANGLNFGSLIGFTYIDEFFDDDPVGVLRLGPRIGYAGTLQKSLGYWLRGGPSFFGFFSDGDDAYNFAASFEALATVTPVPRFSILFGPNVDVHIWGKQGG